MAGGPDVEGKTVGVLSNLGARGAASVWVAVSSNTWGDLPRPSNTATVHAPGVDPDRVLLLGSGTGVGYSVLSHDLALAGHLARKLSFLTGRGTDVDVDVDHHMSASMSRTALSTHNASRFDAVVMSVGAVEAVTMTPIRQWERDIRALFETLTDDGPASLMTYFLAIPPLASMMRLPRLISRAVARQVDALNDAAQRIADEFPQVVFVESPSGIGGSTSLRGQAAFERWASHLAPVMVAGLDTQMNSQAVPVVEADRQRALDGLGVIGVTPDERLLTLVNTARNLFEAQGASVNLIDSDRQVVLVTAGLPYDDRPRSDTFCDFTIRRPGVLVVPDTSLDPRFSHRPWAQGADAVRFYAGYPVEAPDGSRVGALCVVDSRPRSFTDQDEALLRDLALRAQAILWEPAVLS